MARQIGTHALEKQLVACVNTLSPCESIYRREGKICQEKEIPAILRTTAKPGWRISKRFSTIFTPTRCPSFL
ncbi:MAG: divalent-cation tolerance protein CutA [Akkermansiaceae bacterium]|nr:divalent-cation tolerance protein CutA [Akkermansiaceae bacterium]